MAAVITFIRSADRKGLCFGGWPDSILGIYLGWHHKNGGLVLVEEQGDLVAVAVGTKMLEDDIDKHWVPWNEDGDSLYFSDIVATTRQGMAACVDELDKPPKQGQVPEDPYGPVTSPIIPTHSTVDWPKEKKYGITGPAPLPIAHPGMLPAPNPMTPGIPQVVFRMRILQQLWAEQLLSEEEYQEKKTQIMRSL